MKLFQLAKAASICHGEALSGASMRLSADETNFVRASFIRRFLFWAAGYGVTSPRAVFFS